jgi:endonuclease YncB( thermonuclease family)
VKGIERIRKCRLLLRGLLYLIGPALGVFNFLVHCSDMQAEYFSGRVVGVSDGDTINVMHDGRAEKIRLYGIDATEKGQAFGKELNSLSPRWLSRKMSRLKSGGRTVTGGQWLM